MLNKCRNILGGQYQVCVVKYMEARMKCTYRCTRRPRLSNFVNPLGGNHQVSFGMYIIDCIETMMKVYWKVIF